MTEPTPLPRFVTVRAIPLYDDHGRLVRVVKPGTPGRLAGHFDGSGPGVPRRDRAMVRFDDDPGLEAWDVDLESLVVEASA